MTLSGDELDRALHAVPPVVPGLADHAGDQVDVDVGKAGVANPVPGFVDFGRQVRAAVFFEDRVAEVLDAQAQPRDAQLAERVHLRLARACPARTRR